MKNLKFTKGVCTALLTGAISLISLTGCGLQSETDKSAYTYEVVLDDLDTGENQYALDYVNSLGFTNESFRQSFYDYLADGAGNCFINSKQSKVVSIELSNIDDLTDLRLFPNLKKVSITNSNITNFEELAKLENLETVEFNNMTVDCATLTNLKTKTLIFNKVDIQNKESLNNSISIEELSIAYSHFKDIDFISEWKNIKTIELINADINDYSCLENKELESVTIKFCQVNDWSFITTLDKLKDLDVSYTNYEDISLITNLKSLKSLNMAYTLIGNIDGISKLKQLETLSLDSCQNLTNYDEVAELKKLKNFNCINLEMQTNINTLSTIMDNCENVINCDINIKGKIEELYKSLKITESMDEAEKVQIITTTVLDLIDYDSEGTAEDLLYYNCHELKSALDGKGMCQSYTGLTCALLDLAGIENCSIVGENFQDNEQYLHRWIVVKVNGEWLGLDTTFLDDINASEKISQGNDTEYYLDELNDETWKEFHYPYFMPEMEKSYNLNLAY